MQVRDPPKGGWDTAVDVLPPSSQRVGPLFRGPWQYNHHNALYYIPINQTKSICLRYH